MGDRSNLFGGAEVGHAERAKRAVARPLRARQEKIARATGSEESAATSTAEAADSTQSSDSSETGTAASQLVTALSTDAGGNVQVVTDIITVPPWTATSWSAYKAAGVNTTHKQSSSSITPIHFPGLEPTATSTHTKSTPTHIAPGAWATHHGVAKNVLTKCGIDGKNNTWGPFCNPDFQQNLWVGYTYAFTWNSDLFPLNATNKIQLQYADSSLGNATVTDPVANYFGYYNITMDESWLKGAAGNDSDFGQNMTIVLIVDPAGDPPEIVATGPRISLVRDPKSLPKVHYKKLSSKYGLEVGLPVALIAFIIIVLSLCCAYRKRGHSLREARGIGRDYMAKRARRRGHKGGDIQLDEMEMGPEDMEAKYTDQPVKGGGNAFQDEIRRQREEDDALKKQVTSY